MNTKTDFFGNKGGSTYSVPVSFARGGVQYSFKVTIAADDRYDAIESANEIAQTSVGKIYFSKGRLSTADQDTILSILRSIECVHDLFYAPTDAEDYELCADENEVSEAEEEETAEEEEEACEEDEDGGVQSDTFGNMGDHLYHVPCKVGTFLNGGDDVWVSFNVEIAADSVRQAKERAEAISWDVLVTGMTIERESADELVKSFEELAGVVFGSVDYDYCEVPEEEFEVVKFDSSRKVLLVVDNEEDDDAEKEDEDDEICEDDFGNEGEKFWWVPMEFAMETFVDNEVGEGEVKKFTFHLKIAADNEGDAVKRAGEVALHDITGDADDDECFCDMTEDDTDGDLNTQYDSTCDADWEDSDMTFYLRVNEDGYVEECFI